MNKGRERVATHIFGHGGNGALIGPLTEHLWACAETVHRFGHDRPEEVDGSDHGLIERMLRQRARVARAVEGNDPDAVAKHVEALTRGMRVVMGGRPVGSNRSIDRLNWATAAQIFCEIQLGQLLGPNPGAGGGQCHNEPNPHADSLCAQCVAEFRRYYGWRDEGWAPGPARRRPNKRAQLIAPSKTEGALRRSWRSAAIKIAVCQCPCGTAATTRCPRRAGPCRRVMLVVAQVSSMNQEAPRSWPRSGHALKMVAHALQRGSPSPGKRISALRRLHLVHPQDRDSGGESKPSRARYYPHQWPPGGRKGALSSLTCWSDRTRCDSVLRPLPARGSLAVNEARW
jgi:hypothetical protein